MIVEEDARILLRDEMDKKGAKVVAAQAGVDRKTLYNVLAGVASEQTLRKLGKVYPTITCTTSTNSVEPIPA